MILLCVRNVYVLYAQITIPAIGRYQYISRVILYLHGQNKFNDFDYGFV